MQRRNLLIASILPAIALAGWWFLPVKNLEPVAVNVVGNNPDVKVTDPVAVFQRAFWKRPSAGDRILHAERREWKDAGAVSRWQWFLEVEPSPEIVRYLRDDNAFRLRPAKTAVIPANAPSWFVRDLRDAHILTAPGGMMQLVFTGGADRLFALGGGGGFEPGVPESVPVVAQAPATPGRISASSPSTRANP